MGGGGWPARASHVVAPARRRHGWVEVLVCGLIMGQRLMAFGLKPFPQEKEMLSSWKAKTNMQWGADDAPQPRHPTTFVTSVASDVPGIAFCGVPRGGRSSGRFVVHGRSRISAPHPPWHRPELYRHFGRRIPSLNAHVFWWPVSRGKSSL